MRDFFFSPKYFLRDTCQKQEGSERFKFRKSPNSKFRNRRSSFRGKIRFQFLKSFRGSTTLNSKKKSHYFCAENFDTSRYLYRYRWSWFQWRNLCYLPWWRTFLFINYVCIICTRLTRHITSLTNNFRSSSILKQ